LKALVWHGTHDVRVETVPDPTILNPRDAVIRITATAICGSDLHLYDGYIPSLVPGDILGHEFMGEVVELGRNVANLKVGDKVVVPFNISCGQCYFCEHELFSACDNSNPKSDASELLYGHPVGAAFGYAHMFGGYAGGQAQYVRVPYADVGPIKVPQGMPDEKVLFLSDIFPTGYMAAENCNIHPGDVVAVWGCGPVGQFAIQSAYLLGAERVIAIDRIPERLAMARDISKAEIINYEQTDAIDALKAMTGGRGPDSCIDAVGLEAHGTDLESKMEHAKQITRLTTDRATALRNAIQAVRKGGTVSLPGVYGGFVDKMPMGAAFGKGLTFHMGQTHTQKYMQPLMERIERGEIDPAAIITHRLPLSEAAHGYKIFRDKQDSCIKVVLDPAA